MLVLIYDPHFESIVQEKILPHLRKYSVKLVPYPEKSVPKIKSNEKAMLFLDDQRVAELLMELSKFSGSVGLLPHPDSKYIFTNFGTSKFLEEAIQDILTNEEVIQSDLLLCNKQAILHSVYIGDVFTLRSSLASQKFWKQLRILFGKFLMLFSLRHSPFTIVSSDSKKFDTCALGIVAVEHAESSFVTKKLVPSTNINDGMLHAIIVSPRSVLELLRFLIKNLFPEKIRSAKLPEFISHIKNSCLEISNPQAVDFEADGISYSSKTIILEVLSKKLPLIPGRNLGKQNEVTVGKSAYRTKNLPQGETKQELIANVLPFLHRASTEDFKDLFVILRENANSTQSYLTMMVLSTLLASLGLFSNSSPVIIGAMILAPLMAPIISLSMAVLRQEEQMMKISVFTIAKGTFLSLGFAALLTLIMPLKSINSEIGARVTPTILDLGIAIVSGIAGAFAHAKEGIAKSLAGVAIAVALVPPLAVAGIGIGWMDLNVFWGAFLLYSTNLAGIVMSASITFLVLGFSPFKKANRGLVITFVLVVLVSIPLSISFSDMRMKAEIENELNGMKVRKITLKDVVVRESSPLRISARLVAYYPLTDDDLNEAKEKIMEKLKKPVTVEFVTSIVR